MSKTLGDLKEVINKTKNDYLNRVKYIDQQLQRKGLHTDFVELEDGSKIKVMISLLKIPSRFKNKMGKSRIRTLVYIPNLWFTDSPPPTDHRELRLSPLISSGNIDLIVILKAEGLNNLAYCDENGNGICQNKVSAAAIGILKNYLSKTHLDKEGYDFYILGYSEGASQGVSIAAKIIQNNLGSVKEYISICGGGLIGAKKQIKASPIAFVEGAFRDIMHNNLLSSYKGNYFIPRKQIENIENLIGLPPAEPLYKSLNPEFRWFIRYLKTRIDEAFVNSIPQERLKAMASINPDYDYIIKNNVPLIVFLEIYDIIFSFNDLVKNITKLKNKYPTKKIVTVVSDSRHDKVWTYPSGISYVLENIRVMESFK